MKNPTSNIFDDMALKNIDKLIDYDTLADVQSAIRLPSSAPTELRLNLLAAMKAHYGGYRSIDYVKKNFSEGWEHLGHSKEEDTVREVMRISLDIIWKLNTYFGDSIVQGNIGIIVARAALWRLQNSFKSALILIKEGYFYEAVAIERQIFEQLSWCYSIYNLDHIETIKNSKVTKSIHKIKNDFGEEFGRFYNFLTKHAHITADLLDDYIEINGNISTITFKSIEKINMSAYIMLTLIYLYETITEIILFDVIVKHNNVRKNENNELVIIKDCNFIVEVLSKYKRQLWY